MMDKGEKVTPEQAQSAVDKWITIHNTTEQDESVIEIDGVIGPDWWDDDNSNTAKAIKAKIRAITAIKAKKIIVLINSPGGLISDGLAIHDALAVNPAEIITDVQGIAASMATVIAQSGDVRKMSDNALYLIHQPMTVTMGNINTHKQSLVDLEAYNKRLVNIYVKRSGKSEEEIRELMDKNDGYGIWIDGAEAKEIGLIDEVYEPMKAAAMVDLKEYPFLNLPLIPENKKRITKKPNNMAHENPSKIMELFNNLAAEIKSLLNIGADNTLPETVTAKLTEFEARVKAAEEAGAVAETAKAAAEAAQAQADGKVEAVNAELATAKETVTAKEKEIETLKAEKVGLEGQITKMKAASTGIPGVLAQEDPNNPVPAELAQLNADVAKLKAEHTVVSFDPTLN